MFQQTDLERQVTELYALTGHQVERVLRRGTSTSDLIINANNGEKWVARCERSKVNDAVLMDFFQVLQSESAKQGAIITTGAIVPEVRQLVKGKPIRLVDGNEFQAYLRRARTLAQTRTQAQKQSRPPTKREHVEPLSAYQAQSTAHRNGVPLYAIAALLLLLSILSGVFVAALYSRQVTRTAVDLQQLKATEQYLLANAPNLGTYRAGVEAAAEAKGYTITEDGSLVRVTPLPDHIWFSIPLVLFAAAVMTTTVGIIRGRKMPKRVGIAEQSQQSSKAKRANTVSLVITALTIITVVMGGIGGWYYLYGPCGTVRVKNASQGFADLTSRWLAADNIASSTPRIALSGQISNLQSLRDEAGNLKVPSCLDEAKLELLAGMDSAIQAYIAFMAQRPDAIVSGYFDVARIHIANFTDMLLEINGCAPLCK